MPEYSTLSRFSRAQLYSEERKQRAHLKKIAEMQCRNGLDNGAPPRFPHLHQSFVQQLNKKRQEIVKENEAKSKKLVDIMTSITLTSSPPSHPMKQMYRKIPTDLTQDNAEYQKRIAKVKGRYDVREWKKEYQQHREYLRISKDNKLFTPLDIGINRQRNIKISSSLNSIRITPTSSTINVFQKHSKYDRI